MVKTLHIQLSCAALLALAVAAGWGKAYPVKGHPSFADDGAFLDLAIARTILESHEHSPAPGQPAPATRHGLWRMLLAGIVPRDGGGERAAAVLSAVFSLLLLIATVAGTRRWMGREAGLVAGLLLAWSAGLAAASLAGAPLPVAALCVTGAVWLHLRGLHAGSSPMPASSAVLTGLAATIRIEFALLWILFFVHALALSARRAAGGAGVAHAAIKGWAGVFAIACVIAPQVAWNLHSTGVPWPRAADAAVTVESLSTGAAAGLDMDRVVSLMRAIPPMDQPLFLSALAIGYVLLAVALLRREAPASLTFFFTLPLLPFILVLASPLLGWSGVPAVLHSLAPMWCAVAGFGPAYIGRIAAEKGAGAGPVAEALRYALPAVIVLPLAFAGYKAESRSLSEERNRIAAIESAREAIARAVESGAGSLVLTDAPGWLALKQRRPVMDLSGSVTPAMLGLIGADGALDAARAASYIASRRPSWAAFAGEAPPGILSRLPCEPVESERARVCRFNWTPEKIDGGS